MYDILEGIRVVELAMFAFGPSACAVLGDWGADVIKVGHPGFQDPLRGIPVQGLPARDDDLSFTWEQLNRNKRSVAIDVALPEGRALLDELLRDADVFVTNLLPDSRAKLRLDVDDVRSINPNIIYARATGQGTHGPDRERGAYDHTAFWCRSGIGHATSMTADEFIPLPGPALGDLTCGMVLASGVVGALYRRERTGKPSVVDASLLGTGMWMFSPAIVAAGMYDGLETFPRPRHADLAHALVAAYETADGRHIYIAGVRTDLHWESLCRCIGRLDMLDDERFATPAARMTNAAALVHELDVAFGARTLADWMEALEALEVPWTVAQTAREALHDAQAVANGYVIPVEAAAKTSVPLVSSPVQFDEEPPVLRPAPEHGQHTEEVLLELGRSWDDIASLKQGNVIA